MQQVTVLLVVVLASLCAGQRIHTVEVGNSRYFVSNASPYSPQLNWFLAYQYCRTIGMELLSLESDEEVIALNTFLEDNNNARSDYWTSGNQLGSAMWIWMSTGQPYNSTFSYWPAAGPPLTKTQQACMSMGTQSWTAENCMDNKAFICEQTRCFYYNYVTSNRQTPNQGNATTTSFGASRSQSSSRTPSLAQRLTSNRPQQQQSSGPLKIMATTSPSSTLKTMPTTSSPLKIMPFTSPALLKTMPTTQALKIMPTTSSPTAKIMPTTEAMLKSMPTTLKSMPSAAPDGINKVMPVTVQSASNHNNEILPISPLALLQPPQHEFASLPATQPSNSTLTQQLSRKETFSWALLDGDAKK